MWRGICAVVLPFAVDGLVALALENGDKRAQPVRPRMMFMTERGHGQAARPGAGLPLLVAEAVRSAAVRTGKKSQEQRVLR